VALLLIPLASTAVIVCAFVGWRMMRTNPLEAVAAGLLPSDGDEAGAPLLLRLVDGLGVRSSRLLLSAYGPRRRARLDARLEGSGRPEGLTERDFLRRKAGFTVLGLIMGLFFWLSGQGLLALVLVAACFLWMDVWLRAVRSRRQHEIAKGLPDFLDVLAVTVSAGLSLQGALERVAASDEGPLGQEVRRTLNDLRYGMSRRQALEALRNRNSVPSLSSFVTAMLQAEELGTPLAQALMEIAGEVRRDSAQLARQQAAKAGPKVSLVVTTTIVPGAMLLITAGLVLSNIPRFQGVFGG
jgi:tight adherence protein C